MPTYDYHCKTCGHTFEHFQSITSEPLQRCVADQCTQEGERKGQGQVERLISAGAGLVFKGKGFYQTDYVRKSEGSASTPESKPTAPTPDSKPSSSDSKSSSSDSKPSSSDSKSSSSDSKSSSSDSKPSSTSE